MSVPTENKLFLSSEYPPDSPGESKNFEIEYLTDKQLQDALDVGLFMEELGGCGRFQVILTSVLYLAQVPTTFSMMLMAFGNYNPGWRCLDDMDNSSLANITFWETSTDACSSYEACQNVMFNPESVTVVTEWGLLCDRVWISSVIISVQMAGVLVGAYLTGYMGDKIGRKLTFCLSILMNSIFNTIAYFSTSWQMFAVMRFLIGTTFSCMVYIPFILASEFSSSKYRSVIASLPSWAIGGILFAACAMFTKDWRQVQLFNGIIAGVLLLPPLWAPESIHWLTLRNRKAQVIAVTRKVAKINRKTAPEGKTFEALWNNVEKDDKKHRKYSWRHLWKGKAFKRTAIFTPLWFTMSLIYYSLSFGIKSLVGNFYTNLMISFILETPVFMVSAYMPNLLGRKRAMLFVSVFNTMCLFIVVGFDRLASSEVKGFATLVLILLLKLSVIVEWTIMTIFMAELYPTVIRTTCTGYGSMISRIGGIAAPYLIPNDTDTYFISYSVMAVLILICTLLVLLLPETKGTRLMDTWAPIAIQEQSKLSLNEEFDVHASPNV